MKEIFQKLYCVLINPLNRIFNTRHILRLCFSKKLSIEANDLVKLSNREVL